MTQREAFAEPTVPRESPLGSVEPAVSWYLESTRQEAVAGRALINQLYARIPDSAGMFRARLRSANNAEFLGEEEGGQPAGHGLLWMLDPIDGTVNFLHSFPPFIGTQYTALLGQGAFANNKQLHVSHTSMLADALIDMTSTPLAKMQSARTAGECA
jgi:hypothetical protein